MESPKTGILILTMLAVTTLAGGFLGWTVRQQGASPQSAVALPVGRPSTDLLRTTDDPIHFKPAIDSPSDDQSLACHREVLEDKVRETTPAGVQGATSKACYRSSYLYPRHAREGMVPEVTDWAMGRPIESEIRFQLPAKE